MHLFKVKRHGHMRSIVVSLLAFCVIVVGIVGLLNQTQQKSSDEQIIILKDALRRAAANCYAAEGRYPPTLAYLTDNYGVIVNEDRFIVKYSPFAENIMPDITVLEVGKEQAEHEFDEI